MAAKVAILGAGTMGTLYAYLLAADNEVTLIDVRGDVVESINAQGVQIDDLPPRAVTASSDPARAFATNYLFVFVKAPNTLAAIRPFAGQLNPATPIVSLQNGLGNEEAIKAALGSNVPLVIGITNESALAVGHGRSRRLGVGTTVVGSGGASTATVRTVQALLQTAGLDCSIAYDIHPHQWGKLLANAAINPISALIDSKNSIILTDPNAAELARSLALEAAAVAKALHINLPLRRPVGVRAEHRFVEYRRLEFDDRRSQRAPQDRGSADQRRDRRRGQPDRRSDPIQRSDLAPREGQRGRLARLIACFSFSTTGSVASDRSRSACSSRC